MRKWLHISFTIIGFFWVVFVQAQKNALPLHPSVISSTPLYNTVQQDSAFVEWNKQLQLFVFLSPDCPLCRNYAPLINKLQTEYGNQVQVHGIVPGRSYPDSQVNEFIKTFSVPYPVLKDSRQQLKNYFNASTTPEVFLLGENGTILYSGAIDNWAVALGKQRIKTTEHYLLDAIKSTLNNIPIAIKHAPPVGCIINDY